MKLTSYSYIKGTNYDFQCFTFENENGDSVEVTTYKDKQPQFEVNGSITKNEMEEVFKIIGKGKVEIEL